MILSSVEEKIGYSVVIVFVALISICILLFIAYYCIRLRRRNRLYRTYNGYVSSRVFEESDKEEEEEEEDKDKEDVVREEYDTKSYGFVRVYRDNNVKDVEYQDQGSYRNYLKKNNVNDICSLPQSIHTQYRISSPSVGSDEQRRQPLIMTTEILNATNT